MSDDSTTQVFVVPRNFSQASRCPVWSARGQFRRRDSAAEGRWSVLWIGGWTGFVPSENPATRPASAIAAPRHHQSRSFPGQRQRARRQPSFRHHTAKVVVGSVAEHSWPPSNAPTASQTTLTKKWFSPKRKPF